LVSGFWFLVCGFGLRAKAWTLPATSKPGTKNRKLQAGNRKPETRNHKPETKNQTPETRDPRPESRNPKRSGYILFETLVSLALLSVGLIAVNRAMREAILVRGLARDYTQVRLLLETMMAKLELQPMLLEESQSGSFEGDLARFHWKWNVAKVDVPAPAMPSDLPPEEVEKFKLSVPYLTKMEVTVSWERSGREYEQTAETLWIPEKLFVPKEKTLP